MTAYSADAKGILQYLNDLGMRQKELAARVDSNALRNDPALAHNLAVLADRLKRQTDRAVAKEYLEFCDDRDREAAEARRQARQDAENCRRWQATYNDSYQSFGVQTPAPVADEKPGDFRRRLFAGLQSRL
jgi:hypothetical protein